MIALGTAPAAPPPVPQRRDFRRDRAERRQRGERRPRLGRPAELQQRQRTLQMPVAQRRLVLGQRRGGVEQRERVGRPLLLQQLGGEVQPGAGIVGRAGEAVAQQRLGRLGFAGNAHEGAEIGGGGRMAGGAAQRLTHRRLGVLDASLPVAGEAEIDPGVRPTRRQANRGGESRVRRVAGSPSASHASP